LASDKTVSVSLRLASFESSGRTPTGVAHPDSASTAASKKAQTIRRIFGPTVWRVFITPP
jgi:hypothetical protein